MQKALLVGCLCLAACGPASVQEQVKGYSNQGRGYRAGQLDSSLTAIDGHDSARSANSDFPLYWAGYDGSRMCVKSTMDYQVFNTPPSVMAKNYAEGVKKVRLSVAVYDTYEDVAAVPPPPQPSDNRVTMDRPYWVSFDNTDDKHQRWETASEYCVDAPPIAASSRLVVVTTYQPDRNNVYVFEIQSAPKASAGAAASPTVAESSTSDATQAPAGATQSTSNLLETLKEQKGYLAFLTIVDCAGKNDELANGAFDVLAFSDPTVLRVMPNKKERLGLKKKPEACLAIYNAHVAKQVSNEGDTAKALSLDGKSHSASLDSSLAVIKTTNGTIYPVTEMWRP